MTPASISYAYSILAQQKRRNAEVYQLLCDDVDEQIIAAAKRGTEEIIIIVPEEVHEYKAKLIAELIKSGYTANFVDDYNLWISWEDV